MLLVANTNVNELKKQRRANNLNNGITVGVFLVAILNIIISAFGIKNSDDVQEAIRSALDAAVSKWISEEIVFFFMLTFFKNFMKHFNSQLKSLDDKGGMR